MDMAHRDVSGRQEAGIGAIARAVASGSRSAADFVEQALARADAYDAIQPQAWISRATQAAVWHAARQVDERCARGEALPLAGVPFVVKDNFDVAGMDTTVGCPAFAFAPQRTATAVARLQAAGAVLLGKTNLDQFATGLVGTRSPYGAPGCVFDREYVSGGSSSGSAVLVAAGVVPLALGSDTAGSGRVPAAFNGIVGLKPTRGRYSSSGLFPACRSLDCTSVFTATLADAELVDDVLAAFDETDPYSRQESARIAATPASPRIGVPRAGQREFFGDPDSAQLFEEAIGRLRSTSASIVEVDIAPLTGAAQLLYSGPWVAERLVAIEGFLREHPTAVHPVVRTIIQGARGYSAADAFRGMYELQARLGAAARLWREIDALLLPTAPTIYRISEVLAEPLALNGNLGHYTNFVNLLDMCALAVPSGYRGNGTGFGVSLVGPAWTDRALLAMARQLRIAASEDARPALDLSSRVAFVRLAVVGAHLSGQPLNWQLGSRAARLVQATRTAPLYRLYAMAGQVPPKPALVHAGSGASSIEVEVYELDLASFGSFVAEVAPPLAIGSVVLQDGSTVRGFVAEPRALEGAIDISALGGWRAYLAQRNRAQPPQETT
jgi:allophanate hydrolase